MLRNSLAFGICSIALCLSTWIGQPSWGQGADAYSSGSVKAPSDVSEAAVRKLLRRLEADTLQERDSAEQELVEMGPAVLPFLPEVNARTSGEMKIRLERIRASMEATNLENFFEASLVNISGKFLVAKAIAQISEQTGNEIQLQGEDALSSTEVELDCQDEPFWQVMNSVMEQANLRVNAFGSTEGQLVLVPGGGNNSQVFTSGPFRMDTLSVQSTLPFNSAVGGQLGVSLQVTWEPRLKPVFMQIPMASVEATIDDGAVLAASNPQAVPEVPLNYGGCSTQIDLQLERPERTATQLQDLEGEFVVAVPSDRHKYVFKNFGNMARQSEKFGDVTVTLEGARRNGAVYEMRLLIAFGNSQGALDSFRGWILSNEAYLLDAKKVRKENVGLQTYGVSPNSVGIAYLFQINGDPNDYQLIYESPGVITKQTVQYRLQNIQLP